MFEGPRFDSVPNVEEIAEGIKGRIDGGEIFSILGNDILNYATVHLPNVGEIRDVPNTSDEDMDVLIAKDEDIAVGESYIPIDRSETYQSDILFNAVARGFIPGQRSRRLAEAANNANA